MQIREATQSYETWLAQHAELVEADLARKHALMHDDAFGFFRATFYRWTQRFADVCKELCTAPVLLAVGDLHAENFGTWRDGEGRLVWGVNDFDEAGLYPYTNDLVRLAASLLVAIDAARLPLDGKEAANAVLAGYRAQFAGRAPAPFVLEEDHDHLRAIAIGGHRTPQAFWKKILAAKTVEPPKKARKLLDAHMPEGYSHLRHVRRVAGAGSLGLPRFVSLGRAEGALVAREAKARVPSAAVWAGLETADFKLYDRLVARMVRARDPFLWPKKQWLLRRLGPHCERIELSDIDRRKPLLRIVEAMGAEAANAHRADAQAHKAIAADLNGRDPSWLHHHAGRMAEDVLRDWKAWRKT